MGSFPVEMNLKHQFIGQTSLHKKDLCRALDVLCKYDWYDKTGDMKYDKTGANSHICINQSALTR